MKSALQILQKTKELIGTPDTWTSRTSARDNENQIVHYWNSAACKFCVSGALFKVTHGDPDEIGLSDAQVALGYACRKLFGKHVSFVWVNDGFGFDAIHIALDEAINDLKGKK